MKTLFLHAHEKIRVRLPKKALDQLPQTVCLLAVIQFHNQLPYVKKQLETKNKHVVIPQTTHTFLPGHLLGCNVETLPGDFDAFLYIGDGLFHPKALLLRNPKPVFVYNPTTDRFFEVQRKEITDLLKKRKAALTAFYASQDIGVLITTKIGQTRLADALKLKEKFLDKHFSFFLDNTLDFNRLEDFPFIQCWVNTACPRLGYDDTVRTEKPLIEIDEILTQSRRL